MLRGVPMTEDVYGFSRDGGVMTAQLPDAAPVALALLGSAGTVERATSRFLDRFAERLAQHQDEIERVVGGGAEQLSLSLDGLAAELCAVVGPERRRGALLTVAGDGGERAERPLGEWIDDSPAIVWLKDLDGRYLRVNRTYVERLQTEGEEVRGRTDSELAPRGSIEAARLRGDGPAPDEPLELEYTVPAFDDRPAFAVLRFALRDADGRPTAVCGVAAALHEAHLARAECQRLMQIERWSRRDDDAIRVELLEEWGVELVSASQEGLHSGFERLAVNADSDLRAVIAAEREASGTKFVELQQQLDEARLRAEEATLAAEEATSAAVAAAAQAEEQRAAAEEQAEMLEELRAATAAASEKAAENAGPCWNAAAQRALSAGLAGVTEWRVALRHAVQTLGAEGHWDVVVAWCPAERRGAMKCAAAWTSGEEDLTVFETEAWQHQQDVTGTEFGRARTRTGATCLLELPSAEDSLLKEAAARGLNSAVLVPIQGGSETIGILQLLSRKASPPSSELTLFLEGIALQLAELGELLNLAMTPRWRTRF